MYTLTQTFRTKREAQQAVRSGVVLHLVRSDGKVLDQANGSPFYISGKLDHYKEWSGTASVRGGVVRSIR